MRAVHEVSNSYKGPYFTVNVKITVWDTGESRCMIELADIIQHAANSRWVLILRFTPCQRLCTFGTLDLGESAQPIRHSQ